MKTAALLIFVTAFGALLFVGGKFVSKSSEEERISYAVRTYLQGRAADKFFAAMDRRDARLSFPSAAEAERFVVTHPGCCGFRYRDEWKDPDQVLPWFQDPFGSVAYVTDGEQGRYIYVPGNVEG